MRNVKVVIISLLLALLVYGIWLWFSNRSTSLSPIPEEGIKVIQISPADQ